MYDPSRLMLILFQINPFLKHNHKYTFYSSCILPDLFNIYAKSFWMILSVSLTIIIMLISLLEDIVRFSSLSVDNINLQSFP